MVIIIAERLQFDENGKVVVPQREKLSRMCTSMKRKLSEESDNSEIVRSKNKKPRIAKPPNRDVYKREFVVEKILDHILDDGKHYFYVKWEGWDSNGNTWEPAEHLEHCPEKMNEFLGHQIQEHIELLRERLNIPSQIHKHMYKYIPEGGFKMLHTDKLEMQKVLMGLITFPPAERHVRRIEAGKQAYINYFLLLQRECQLKILSEWEEKLNKTDADQALIKVQNDFDLELPPSGFVYINAYLPTEGVKMPNDPLMGCTCQECNGKEKQCCGTHEAKYFQYYGKGRLNMPPGCPIFECNRRCTCGPTCRNRVVQRGRQIPLCIFRTQNGRGWGVKTMRNIFRGEFVCEYVGEVISHEEAERRGQVYDAEGCTYLFDLDYNSSNNPYTVDAATYGNISHFINHSCQPNVGVWSVWIDCIDPNLPRLALFALRNIEKDEELTFDYKFNNGDTRSPKSRQKEGKMICKCMSKRCKKYLF